MATIICKKRMVKRLYLLYAIVNRGMYYTPQKHLKTIHTFVLADS